MSDGAPRSWFFFKGRKPGAPVPPRAVPKKVEPAPTPARVVESLEERIRRIVPRIAKEREAAAKAAAEKAKADEEAAYERWDQEQELLAERLARGDMYWPGDPTPIEYRALRRPSWFPKRWW